MPTKDKKPHPNDHVYLARRQSDGALKIGVAMNVMKRMTTLEARLGCKMELLGAMPGSLDLEATLHERFQKYAIPGQTTRLSEWFYDNEEIIEYAKSYMQSALDFAIQRPLPLRKRSGRSAYVFAPRVLYLLAMKQINENKYISLKTMSKDSGINYLTCLALVKGKRMSLVSAVLGSRLKTYFGCKLEDLFTIELRNQSVDSEEQAS